MNPLSTLAFKFNLRRYMLQRVVVAVPAREEAFFRSFLRGYEPWAELALVRGRGLPSSTFQLNLSRLVTNRVTPTSVSHRKCLC